MRRLLVNRLPLASLAFSIALALALAGSACAEIMILDSQPLLPSVQANVWTALNKLAVSHDDIAAAETLLSIETDVVGGI